MAGRKYKFEVNKEMLTVLQRISSRRDNLPISQALRRAVLVLDYLDAEAESGKEFFISDPETGITKLLTFESSL